MSDVHLLSSAERRVYSNSARSSRSDQNVELSITIKELQPLTTVTFSIVTTRKNIGIKKVPTAKRMTTARKKKTVRKIITARKVTTVRKVERKRTAKRLILGKN